MEGTRQKQAAEHLQDHPPWEYQHHEACQSPMYQKLVHQMKRRLVEEVVWMNDPTNPHPKVEVEDQRSQNQKEDLQSILESFDGIASSYETSYDCLKQSD